MINFFVETKKNDMAIDPVSHIPVMTGEILEYLKPPAAGIFVDGTLGLGGHAAAILPGLTEGRYIGIDRDAKALALAKERLGEYHQRCVFVHDNFRNIKDILSRLGISAVDGILLDVGVSSFQLEDEQRGFSLQVDGPLDMRMDQDSPLSAYDLVNSLSEHEIDRILRDFGEERWHRRIACKITTQRAKKLIETTKDLKEIILASIPVRFQRGRIHPATRTFQAFRIAVNRELESLEEVLNRCVEVLNPNGRIGVIAFHSLEDRIVKQKFRAFHREGQLNLVVKKPLRPTEEEVQRNPRARSARFRVAEKTGG